MVKNIPLTLFTDLHTHTIYCDGTCSPEQLVLGAIEKGVKVLGICAHSYTEFDLRYCLKKEKYGEFQAEVNGLKEKYKDKITVLCGIEQDYFSTENPVGFDYVIGSVHYIEVNGEFYEIDDSKEILQGLCEKHFGGDYYLLIEKYYSYFDDIALKTGADIIGHLDLITKYNDNESLFSVKDARYVNAYKRAVDSVVKSGALIEVNTGIIAKSNKVEPCPSLEIVEYALAIGGKITFNSDAHSTDNLLYQFDKWSKLIDKKRKLKNFKI